MINKNYLKISGWKKAILIIILILSYALVKSFNPIAIYSVNSIFLSFLFILGYGIFAWLLFEILVGFMYSGLKSKIENFISMNEFTNLFRFAFIPLNIITYALTNLFILLNFYTSFMILCTTIILSFICFLLIYKILVKNYFASLDSKDLNMSYFSFVFIYLFLMTIMWGTI